MLYLVLAGMYKNAGHGRYAGLLFTLPAFALVSLEGNCSPS